MKKYIKEKHSDRCYLRKKRWKKRTGDKPVVKVEEMLQKFRFPKILTAHEVTEYDIWFPVSILPQIWQSTVILLCRNSNRCSSSEPYNVCAKYS
jgi:hypothetical protein